jgi:hypothetical protein
VVDFYGLKLQLATLEGRPAWAAQEPGSKVKGWRWLEGMVHQGYVKSESSRVTDPWQQELLMDADEC